MSNEPLPRPSRGEIRYVNWTPGRGSEQEGVRPALIVQTDLGNHSPKYPNTIVLAITTTERKIPQHIRVQPTKENGLRQVSYVMTEQIMTISKTRLTGESLGRIEPQVMRLVEDGLRRNLDFPE